MENNTFDSIKIGLAPLTRLENGHMVKLRNQKQLTTEH